MSCHAFLQWIFLSWGLNPCLFKSLALAGRFFTTRATWEAYFIFQSHCMASRVLVLQPGIESIPSAVELYSLNHWTAKEVHLPHRFIDSKCMGFSLVFLACSVAPCLSVLVLHCFDDCIL